MSISVNDAKLQKKAVQRAEPGKHGARHHKVAAMRGEEGKILITPFCRGLLSREIFILYVIFGSSELAENAL